MELLKYLQSTYKTDNDGIFLSGREGYWSNLTKNENKLMIEALKNTTARDALLKYQPWLEDVIYSAKRQAGLEMLHLCGDEVCIDYGCMWGALTVPLALRTKFVLGVDQTLDSLQFLKARLKEEGVDNVALLRNDLRKMPAFPDQARVDVAVVNGVLEWIPEVGDIELKTYYGKHHKKNYSGHPGEQQESFLSRVYQNLKESGKLYLAIENSFDFKMFLGVKDPHSNTLFTSIFPRKIANWISFAKLGRPYVNWLYSFNGIRSLLMKSGFSRVDLYMCFPDYRFPERIIPYECPLDNYRLTISSENANGRTTIKRRIGRLMELITFRVLKAKAFAPSIIAIGHK
jgi:hypothetical protein